MHSYLQTGHTVLITNIDTYSQNGRLVEGILWSLRDWNTYAVNLSFSPLSHKQGQGQGENYTRRVHSTPNPHYAATGFPQTFWDKIPGLFQDQNMGFQGPWFDVN